MNNISNRKSCPRCEIEFQCNSESIENCQCNSIQLSEETKILLKELFLDCLCRQCLLELQSENDLKK